MSDDAVLLKVWNYTDSPILPKTVIVQSSAVVDGGAPIPVWQRICGCSHGCYHPVTFTREAELTVSDAFGNYTCDQSVKTGRRYVVDKRNGLRRVRMVGRAKKIGIIEVCNCLTEGNVNVHLKRTGVVAQTLLSVTPLTCVELVLNLSIELAVVGDGFRGSHLERGDVVRLGHEYNLENILSADILVVGGGAHEYSKPFGFSMENVMYR